MNSNYLQGKIGKALLAVSLLFGIAFLSSTTTQAQYDRDDQYRRDRDRDGDRDRNRDRDWRRQRNRDRDRNRRDDRYGRNGGYGNGGYGNGGYGNIIRLAQNQGYQDGLYTGQNDANRGQSYNPQRSHFYRNGNSGNNSYYGNNGQYIQAYRQGFLRGYNEGFRRFGGFNNRGSNRRRNNGGRFPQW
jgi:Ni/Co efflux regulator RcnB